MSLAVSGSTIFAGTDAGVFLSTNNGTSWTPVNSGLTGDALDIRSLEVSGSTIFAGTDTGVFLSTNNGNSWTPVDSGLTGYGLDVYSFVVSGSTIFAGTYDGVWSRPLSQMLPAPSAPLLSSPANGAMNQPISSTLSWGTVSGATSYSITVYTSNSFSSTISAQSGLNSGSCNITGLAASTTYYWKVSATNIAGTSAWSSTWNFTTVPPVPGIPVLSSPANGALNLPSSVTLSWGTVSGATSYNMQLSTNISFANTLTSQVNLTNGSTAITGLKNNTSYYWRVAGINAGGSSAWSNAWSFSVNYTSVLNLSESVIQPSFSLRNGMVAYSLNTQCPVEIRIYDILGKKIFQFNRMQSAGQYSLLLRTLSLPANLYIVHFKAGSVDRLVRCIER
jgi:hypothetical protein